MPYYINTAEAAKILADKYKKSITIRRISVLCKSGALIAIKKIDRWEIELDSVLSYERRPSGVRLGAKLDRKTRKFIQPPL